ncbi:PREDICTED: glucose dehydrogenase [FAD, quinone]-like [Vollenhovia emeryi]|uniref:glucose dehydrogenase [FAD, quinone]-like n=1 Tax=Vollenhovia emeryi TaxID=411798 RepID=UPI0005F50403|nr:PREDICTED: glucose dehydrogenase [FAD, quinone]-like [Vollenhovia emeryi]
MLKKTSIFIVAIAVLTSVLYMPNKYNNLYGNDIEGSRLINVLRLGKGILDFWTQSERYLAQQVSDTTPQFGETFDFIIIGAGTAGATVAARLSEISQTNVLLIEEGSHERLYMDVPLFASFLQRMNFNKKYRTKSSDKYCLGTEGNSCVWSTAKVVGGGSAVNFMIASRGGVEDYDRWAEMGNEGWAYKDVLKYFKKLETMHITELQSDTAYHGTDGPVHITQPSFRTPVAEAFLEAVKELGYPSIDYNGKSEMGFSYMQATIMNGTRMSSNRAYLSPARDRNNLRVSLESTVTKVLIDPSTNRAIGVEFVKYGQTIRVFANKEVILSAGAIGTPQLMMLSGIGPAKHLTELGISVVQDAPVGENLMDHVCFYGLAWAINASTTMHIHDMINPINPYATDFLTKQTGPLTTSGGCEVIGFVNTGQAEKHDGLPDIELLFCGGTFAENNVFQKAFHFKEDVCQEWDKFLLTYGWRNVVILSKPKSRGRITLLANDINVKPEIVSNYFEHPDDVRTMIAGIRTALSIGQTKTMQALDSQLVNCTYTECNDYVYDSDAYWECAIRTLSSTIFHYSGTCKMGARGDPTAVVDPKLKVIGIQGLRVVDASIMPEIISAHINIPIFMIAEKAADMIKDEWGYLESHDVNKLHEMQREIEKFSERNDTNGTTCV